jgi:hypothetical protein
VVVALLAAVLGVSAPVAAGGVWAAPYAAQAVDPDGAPQADQNQDVDPVADTSVDPIEILSPTDLAAETLAAVPTSTLPAAEPSPAPEALAAVSEPPAPPAPVAANVPVPAAHSVPAAVAAAARPTPSATPAVTTRTAVTAATAPARAAATLPARTAAAAPVRRAPALAGNPSASRISGVWTWSVDANTGADLRSLNAGWARASIMWSDIQPAAGTFNWTSADQFLANASGGGTRNVLVQVRDNPAWAAASRCKIADDPERARLASFLGTMVSRYKGAIPDGPLAGTVTSVKYWQLYNEADNNSEAYDQAVDTGGCFGTHDAGYTSTQAGRDSYAAMVESAGSAIHTADPNAFVVMAGAASGNYASGGGAPYCTYPPSIHCLFDPFFTREVVRDLVAHGTLDRLDMVAVHFFSSQSGDFGNTDIVGRIEALRGDMRAAGLADSALKPVIVDEGSYTSTTGSSTSSATDDFNLKQRNYLVKSLVRAMYERVEAYFWFLSADTPGSDNAYGLRALDGGAKPSFAGMQRFATLLDQRTRFVGKLSLPYTDLEGYEFLLADGRRARVVWNEFDTLIRGYTITDGVVVQATDASGNAMSVWDNSPLVAAAPIYVILGTPQNCRPAPVHITVSPAGGGLNVTVNAASSTLPIRSLQFQAGANALVDIAGQTNQSGAFSVALPSGSFAPTFFVHRATPGASTTLPFTVVDGCGTWQTFVGGGASAF